MNLANVRSATPSRRRNKKLIRTAYPWRDGNQIQILVDGPCFFPRMLECIAGARRYVLLEMYLMESGEVASRFIEALAGAASRGVTVHLLLDDFGARALKRADRQQLLDAGVHLAFFNPLQYGKGRANLYRDHRKLLLVDGEVAFTGGAGITDEFAPTHSSEEYWHDIMVECRGPVVADWQHSFSLVWRWWAAHPLELPPPSDLPESGSLPARLSVIHPPYQEVKGSLARRIRTSRRRIWLVTAYFIPTRKIRRLLRKAARRGVDVRILVPGEKTDHPAVRRVGQRYYQWLLHNGVRIFEYQPRFLHAKVWLCDDWVSVGSTNLDRWTQHWNLEANQEVSDGGFAARAMAVLKEDFARSVEIDYVEWCNRPWYQRLREWFWSTVAMWTQYYSQRRLRSRRNIRGLGGQ